MGLASQFGSDQSAYQCSSCGQKVALYTPSCPKCFNNTLKPLRIEKARSGFQKPEERSQTKTGANPLGSVVLVAIIVGAVVAASNMFKPAPPEPVTIQSPPPVTAKPKVRPRVSTASKRTKRPAPVVSKPSLDSAPSPRPAKPMKLWEASDGE